MATAACSSGSKIPRNPPTLAAGCAGATRLMRPLSLGTPSIYLDMNRVPAPRRDAWITQHVLQRRVPVLITNPEAVKTGLNNLTPYFKTAVWLEPTLNTATFRQ